LYALPLTVIEAPAEAEAVIVPLAAPLQLTLVEEAAKVTAIGWLIDTVVEAVQVCPALPPGALATIV
jgi:hypothetical protein